MQQQIILASQSPRRAEILRWLDVDFLQHPADIDESRLPQESPQDYVIRLAEQKALACAAAQWELASTHLILGSDTTVAADQQVFEKPRDEADMRRMLSTLSGRRHQVFTAVATVYQGQLRSRCVSTEVTFRTVSPTEMGFYWSSGEPQGKAGGYAIQGLGGQFVTHIEGSYTAVMGLPLAETAAMLREAGIKIKGVDR